MAREQRSLFGEILDWMLAPLLLLWPMTLGLTWLVSENIANRPFDRALEETARQLARQVAVARDQVVFGLPPTISQFLKADNSDDIYFQVLGVRGEFVSGDQDLPVPTGEDPHLPGTVQFRNDEVHSAPVRVAYVWVEVAGAVDGHHALVQVAETLNKRSHLAAEIMKGVIVPHFVILPLAVLLVWLALARGIAPLSELQQRIRRRRSDDLSPIDELDAPEEVAPLVRSINELLGRLDQSIQTQKHFLADAAHQLKTPLAGLRMQAELAQQEIDAGQRDPQELKRSLRQIARSSQRAAHVVNQLLALARAENQGQAPRRHEIYLGHLAVDVVRDFVPRAMEKRIGHPAEVGVLGIITATSQAKATEIGKLINPFVLHHPLTPNEELPTFAFPYSPATTNRGALYEFALNHVMRLDDPMEAFRLDVTEVSHARG